MEGETERGSSPPGAPEGGAPEAPDAPAPPTRAALDAQGMERPKFLLDYPRDPALERLIAAFESGNYAFVRREAEAVAKATEDPAVRDAALELRRRIEPDPLAKYLLGLAAALLVFLVVWAYRKSGAQ
jgi:hypothetical protein